MYLKFTSFAMLCINYSPYIQLNLICSQCYPLCYINTQNIFLYLRIPFPTITVSMKTLRLDIKYILTHALNYFYWIKKEQ